MDHIARLIAHHTTRSFGAAPVETLPESHEVRLHRMKMERQARFDTIGLPRLGKVTR